MVMPQTSVTKTWPSSAKDLLKTRYDAFVSGNIDFILESHHPETKEQVDRASIESWSKDSKWEGLTIESEKIDGDKTFIAFTVRYTREAETLNHRENAEFRKHEGRWMYFDSVFPKPETIRRDTDKVGRNDPCSCGSEKKFKKCCGA